MYSKGEEGLTYREYHVLARVLVGKVKRKNNASTDRHTYTEKREMETSTLI